MTKIVADNASILKLVDFLAMFIKQKQAKVKKVENILNKYYKNNNLSQVDKYFIQIYDFIAI